MFEFNNARERFLLVAGLVASAVFALVLALYAGNSYIACSHAGDPLIGHAVSTTDGGQKPR